MHERVCASVGASYVCACACLMRACWCCAHVAHPCCQTTVRTSISGASTARSNAQQYVTTTATASCYGALTTLCRVMCRGGMYVCVLACGRRHVNIVMCHVSSVTRSPAQQRREPVDADIELDDEMAAAAALLTRAEHTYPESHTPHANTSIPSVATFPTPSSPLYANFQNLMSMGFEAQHVIEALHATDNHVEAAIDRLTK